MLDTSYGTGDVEAEIIEEGTKYITVRIQQGKHRGKLATWSSRANYWQLQKDESC